MRRTPRLSSLAVLAALGLMLVGGDTGATPSASWSGTDREWRNQPRSEIPEDRYAMAGGCYAIRSSAGYLERSADGFAATAADLASAEPFHFQATDLGRYLLFGVQQDFVAAGEGALGEAAYGVTRSQPGATAGGLVLEQTDAAADAVARSEANQTAGRGASVVAAPEPSALADWEIDGTPAEGFSITLPEMQEGESKKGFAVDEDRKLVLVDAAQGTPFSFELSQGCAAFPEIEVNVKGPVTGGVTDFQEVRGFVEGHMHQMAFEFIGGRVRCGRPWHRFGVAHALVDCPDHEPGGMGAVLEGILSNGSPDGRHDTSGWPSFTGWPRPGSLTHEQVYYRWLERAWRGGQRLMVNLLVDNGQLCRIYPYNKREGRDCNEMNGVRLQAQRIHELERYIDAQNGGPGEGWFRIVTDPFQARQEINKGKLAVVLGIEVSVPLDCGLMLDQPTCTEDEMRSSLEEVYDLGVRQMELTNKFDNGFSGVTGDSGAVGPVVNIGNFGETGHFWRLETCEEDEPHDKQQPNVHDDSPIPHEHTDRDSIFGAIAMVSGASGAVPLYPEGPHCNIAGLTDLGRAMISEMATKGMMFDPDHMSALARTEALDFIEHEMAVRPHDLPYSGLISSHSWADDTIYSGIHKLGGVVTPHAGSSSSFVKKWEKNRDWADPRYLFGIGFGSDMNGFSAQGEPRGGDAVKYPFAGFGGVSIDQQVSGTKTYDINTDGVAHFGLYPDWIQDVRLQAGEAGENFYEDMLMGAEAYLQMWERALRIAPNACRPDVADVTDDQLEALPANATWVTVLEELGQPSTRFGTTYTYCLTGGRTAELSFTDDGILSTFTTT